MTDKQAAGLDDWIHWIVGGLLVGTGVFCVWHTVGWVAALGVFLIVWGNNVEKNICPTKSERVRRFRERYRCSSYVKPPHPRPKAPPRPKNAPPN